MKKSNNNFFSGWTAVFIVLLGVMVFAFLIQQLMENFQGVGETVGTLTGTKTEEHEVKETKPSSSSQKQSDNKSDNKSDAKELSDLAKNLNAAGNLSEEEIQAIIEQKAAEGEQSLSGGDLQAALKTYNELVELNPNDENAHNKRGDVYQEMKNYTRAVEDYDTAIQLNSDFAIAYCSRGASYLKLGNYDQAIADLNKAIELNPKYAEAYKNRAIYYRAMGDNASAESDTAMANSLAAQGNN